MVVQIKALAKYNTMRMSITDIKAEITEKWDPKGQIFTQNFRRNTRVWSDELIVYLNNEQAARHPASPFAACWSDEVIAVARVLRNAGHQHALRMHGADTGSRVRKDANNRG